MQVVEPPGSSVVTAQLAAVRLAVVAGAAIVSVTASPETVTLPGLVTAKV